MTDVNETDKRELELYAYNTSALHTHFMMVVKNIKRRLVRGTYDSEKAPYLWLYWIDAAARMYRKEFCDHPDFQSRLFNPATRRALAEEIAVSELAAIQQGEYD